MKSLRNFAPALGVLALVALFFLLPAAPGSGCQACSSNSPYVPLVGAGYFSLLTTLPLFFPSFPGQLIARGGLTWSILLALAFIYLLLPGWCPLCAVAHTCHILMWTIWTIYPFEKSSASRLSYKEGLCTALAASFSVVALFSSLNLTLAAYGFKIQPPVATGLQIGDTAPSFEAITIEKLPSTQAEERYIINFISGSCPYCKEQVSILNAFAQQENQHNYRFITVGSDPLPEWSQDFTALEWVTDKESSLRKLFKVSGYPTLFAIGSDGKVENVIAGVPDRFKSDLSTSLGKASQEKTVR